MAPRSPLVLRLEAFQPVGTPIAPPEDMNSPSASGDPSLSYRDLSEPELEQRATAILHDLRNLLQAIYYQSLKARRTSCTGGPTAESLATLHTSIEWALALARTSPRHVNRVDATRLVTDVTSLLRNSIASTIHLDVRVPSRSCWIAGDGLPVIRALLNLATNAHEAMGSHGELSLHLDTTTLATAVSAKPGAVGPGEFARIVVRDTGPGVLDSWIDEAFRLGVSSHGEDRGIGLSVTAAALGRSGGGIRLVGQSSRGATFELLIPKLEPPP